MVAFALSAATFQGFVNEKQIRQQCPDVDRRVEVVDQLGADGWLCEDERNGGLRVARVTIDDADERVIRGRAVGREPIDRRGQRIAETVERLLAAAQILASLAAVFTGVFGRETLSGVTETELVRLFDGVAARSKIGEWLGGLGCIRAQTQFSVSP